jgi:hypothetical protein
MATWYELKNNLKEGLENLKEEILSEKYPEDKMYEIIDSRIPTCGKELARLLIDNPELGVVDDSGLIDLKNINAFKIIQVSMYEIFSQIAYEWLEGARGEPELLLAV